MPRRSVETGGRGVNRYTGREERTEAETGLRALATFVTVLSLGAMAPGQGIAQSASTRGAVALPASIDRLIDRRLSGQYNRAETRARGDETIPRFTGSYRGPYLEMARAAARRHGVPEDLFLRLVQRESNWDPRAVSEKGAIGLAQLMPGTAALLGVDPEDPAQNLEGGARYLITQYRRFGSWQLALAAYNAGPQAVVAARNAVPDYRETKDYVRAILGR